ncbi:hypothetical protein K4H02_26035, partial [Mycobacterium tuberculosis]|nr:hypothetical protein [Mycobacterium tuberculosis]
MYKYFLNIVIVGDLKGVQIFFHLSCLLPDHPICILFKLLKIKGKSKRCTNIFFIIRTAIYLKGVQ